MAFTFVHTADWQIGKAFGRFDPDVAVRLRAARLDAIDRIAAAAAAAGAGHIVVAGDVMDSEHLDDSELRQPLARMAVYSHLVWHLLPGNHDPARAGGVWGRLAGLGQPGNVHSHLQARPYNLEPGVTLLPAPLHAKETRTDPTEWMDGAATPEGTLRIGLAHGSVKGFDSLGEAAVPIEASRLSRAGLDYLALGDWHGMKEIARGVWYSGTPEPDRFTDNDPGHVLIVRLKGRAAPPEVTPIVTGQHRWLARRVVLSRLSDIEPFEAEFETAGAERRHFIVSLGVEGLLTAGEAAVLDARIERLAPMMMALDVDRRRLRVTVGPGDVTSLDDPVLATVASRLRERAQAANAREAAVAVRAMRLLLALQAASGPEAGKTMP